MRAQLAESMYHINFLHSLQVSCPRVNRQPTCLRECQPDKPGKESCTSDGKQAGGSTPVRIECADKRMQTQSSLACWSVPMGVLVQPIAPAVESGAQTDTAKNGLLNGCPL